MTKETKIARDKKLEEIIAFIHENEKDYMNPETAGIAYDARVKFMKNLKQDLYDNYDFGISSLIERLRYIKKRHDEIGYKMGIDAAVQRGMDLLHTYHYLRIYKNK